MPPRYIRYHRIRRDRFRNDPTLLFITPSSAPNHPRYLRAAPNNLRVVTNVDHNVHTLHDPKRITIVHHSPPTQLCGVKTPLTFPFGVNKAQCSIPQLGTVTTLLQG